MNITTPITTNTTSTSSSKIPPLVIITPERLKGILKSTFLASNSIDQINSNDSINTNEAIDAINKTTSKKHIEFALGTAGPRETTIALSIHKYQHIDKTGHIEYIIDVYRKSRVICVRRRYKDFEKLDVDIKRENKYMQLERLPQLPRKRWSKASKWLVGSPTKIDHKSTLKRQFALEFYLRELIRNPIILEYSRSLKLFLDINVTESISVFDLNPIRHEIIGEDEDDLPLSQYILTYGYDEDDSMRESSMVPSTTSSEPRSTAEEMEDLFYSELYNTKSIHKKAYEVDELESRVHLKNRLNPMNSLVEEFKNSMSLTDDEVSVSVTVTSERDSLEESIDDQSSSDNRDYSNDLDYSLLISSTPE